MPSHWRAGNRYVGVEEWERLNARDEDDARDAAAEKKQRPVSRFSAARIKEIRSYYARQIASPIKSFGPTSFDVGGGKNDEDAFDACVESFGFAVAVVALKPVSARAKACASAYRARTANPNTAATRSTR